ncbi:MAG: ABC transporter substrate-binding protein [Lachnospiraceae bacterium]|nr:ABC transporter substrate-binding protein [Lachnospiraceae bacterium]
MKKRLLSILMAGVLAMAAVACGEPAATGNSGSAATESKADNAASGKTYHVGVCQLVQHDALDAATQGFVDALKAAYGDSVEVEVQNAQGDSATCSTIVNGFVANNYDLIMANATPALQAAVSATTTIPIVGTSVTDYATALAINDWNGTTGINVTGTSDLAPLDQQEDMILELVPDAKKVAILYCSAEANSAYQASKIKEYLTEDGVGFEEYTFSDSNDLQAVVTAAVSECDAMYIPTDNTAASNMTLISNVTGPAGMPVICGEENMMKAGGLATLSINYYDIGYAAGEMAVEILTNGKNPAEMAIGTAATSTKEYYPLYANTIGFTVPEGYKAVED